MGLIKSAVQAIGGTFGDQWKDLISCEDMGNDTLMVKKTTPTIENRKAYHDSTANYILKNINESTSCRRHLCPLFVGGGYHQHRQYHNHRRSH